MACKVPLWLVFYHSGVTAINATCVPSARYACHTMQSVLLEDVLTAVPPAARPRRAVLKVDIEGHEIPALTAASLAFWTQVNLGRARLAGSGSFFCVF